MSDVKNIGVLGVWRLNWQSISGTMFFIVMGAALWRMTNYLLFHVDSKLDRLPFVFFPFLAVGGVWLAFFSKKIVTRSALYGVSFLVLAFCALGIQYSTSFSEHKEALDYVVSQTILMFFWYLVGALCSQVQLKKNNFLAVFVVLGVCLSIFFNVNEVYILNYYDLNERISGRDFITHLNISEIVIVPLIFAYAISHSSGRIFVFFVSAFSLFMLGGRSSFALFFAAVMFFELWKRKLSYGKLVLLVGLVGVFFLAWLFFLHGLDVENQLLDRMLLSGGDDESGNVRLLLIENSFSILSDSILVGGVGNIVAIYGHVTFYIHNFLSAWQFYGLPVFLGMVFFAYLLYKRIANARELGVFPIATEMWSILFFYTGFSLLIAKPIDYYLAWFTFGACAMMPNLVSPSRWLCINSTSESTPLS